MASNTTSASRRRVGVVVSYACTVSNVLVQLIYVPILLSTIGQDEYGLYQLIGSVVSYVVSINGILAAGVGRYYCMYKAKSDKVHMENTLAIAKRMYWALSVLTMLVVAVSAMAFHAVYQRSFTSAQLQECVLMLLVLGVNCIVTMNNTINISVITGNERFLFLKGSQTVTLIMQPVIVVLLTQLYPSALSVCCVVLAMNMLCAFVQRLYVSNILRERSTYHGWDKHLAKGLLCFSAVIVLVTIADQIFWSTDQLIIGYMYGAAPVAVYAVGARIFMSYMPFGTTIASVFLPKVSELYHRDCDVDAMSELFIKVGRLSLMVCLAVLGGFAVLGPDFITLWAGPTYFQAYLVAIIVMVPFTVDIIQNLGLTILQVMDKYQFRGVMYLIVALLNIVFTIIMLTKVGLIGAAISTGVAMFIGNGLIMNWYYKAKVGLDITGFWKSMAGIFFPVVALVAVFAVAYWLLPVPHGSWLSVVLGGIAFMIMYVALLRGLVMNDYEKSLLSGAWGKVRKR